MTEADCPPADPSPPPQPPGPVLQCPPARTARRWPLAVVRFLLYVAILASLLWLAHPLFLLTQAVPASAPPPEATVPFGQIPSALIVEGEWQLVGSGLGASVTRLNQQQLDAQLQAAAELAGKRAAASRTDPIAPEIPSLPNPDDESATAHQDSLEFQQSITSLLSMLPTEVTETGGYRCHSGQYFGTFFRIFTASEADSEVYSALAWWPADNTDWNVASINVSPADQPLSAEWIPGNLPVSAAPLAFRMSSERTITGAVWPCNLTPAELQKWFKTSAQDFVVEENRSDILTGRWSPRPGERTLTVLSIHKAETGLLILLTGVGDSGPRP